IKTNTRIETLTEGGWNKWSREVKMNLRAQGAWKYVTGTVVEPKEDTAQLLWTDINDKIVGALGAIVDTSLQRELDPIVNAKEAWDKLKEKTQAKGIIAKLEWMQITIRAQFSEDVPFITTINEIRDTITEIHKPIAPTKDEWVTVLLLNALNSPNYNWLRKNLISFLTNSTITLSVEDIIQRIEIEARENRQHNDENIMAAQSKPNPNKARPKCTLCKRTGHIQERCWEKGGGAEGNAPDWWKKGMEIQKKRKEKAYIAESDDSGSESAAIFMEAEGGPILINENNVEVVSATWEEPSINSEKPYNLDSAATSHCSPVKTDFTDYEPIPPKPVKGVNGA
ncbi:MAG TPA: hypothetical protein VGO47_01030, partial [Chlamydiales bacterium]|nr:hypothetical protein [Chlamydiales bacterium]